MADDPLRALHARLDAFALRADADAVLDVDALVDAREVLAEAGGQGAEAEALRMVAILHWHRHCLTAGGSADDLDKAVELFTRTFHHDPDGVPEPLLPLIEAAGGLPPPAEEERMTWDSLARPFLERYRADGRPEDMWRVIALLTAAWDAEPDTLEEQTTVFVRLIGALFELHRDTGDMAALETLVDRARTTLASEATPAALRPMAWTVLLQGLWVQALRSGDLEVLREAVEAGRRALDLVPEDQPARAGHLSNLGAILLDSYQHTGVLADLDESVHLLRAAVMATPPDDPSWPTRLGNLSRVLRTAFLRRGDMEVLREAVEAGRRALDLVPEDQPARAGHLSNLGAILLDSYQHTGVLADLDESVHLLHTALGTLPAAHPDRGEFANRLSACQWLVHRATGDAGALSEAVASGRAAVEATPVDHPDRPRFLSNLAASLRASYEQTGDTVLLNEAVILSRAAVDATPTDHPDRAARLNNLGNALRTRHDRTGDAGALSEAVASGRAAVEATPVDHPDRPRFLSNLAASLRASYEQTGDTALLDEAVILSRAAVDATPTDHPDRAARLNNLGNALRTRHDHTGDPRDGQWAREVMRAAATMTTGPVHVRMQAAWAQAEAAAHANAIDEAMAAYAAAVSLLPQIAPPRLTRRDRENMLGRFARLGADAAAAALTAGQPELAVELLEQARGFLLSEALSAHRDADELQVSDSALFERFQRLRRLLSDSAEVDQATRIRAAADWDRLLNEIRALPGFKAFLMAPTIADLLEQAHEGPIVLVNASKFRCDALILSTQPGPPVQVVPLADVDLSLLVRQTNRFLDALRDSSDHNRWQSAQPNLCAVLGWLWDAVVGPVLDAIGITGPPADDHSWPIVWWCPVGPFAYLPLHAAGRHGTDETTAGTCESALDRVMSSYTPTIRALLYGRGRPSDPVTGPGPKFRAPLIVAAPQALSAPPLPATVDEARAVEAMLPRARTLIGPEARREAVLAALPNSSIVHLACHAATDWRDVARSSLILHDRAITVADILATGRLDRTELVVLSACSTATGNAQQTDEALHLATAFLSAGAPHVVGTLWAVDDRTAARAATHFYQQLSAETSGALDIEQAIAALHRTARMLRDLHPRAPALWAPFIHLGR